MCVKVFRSLFSAMLIVTLGLTLSRSFPTMTAQAASQDVVHSPYKQLPPFPTHRSPSNSSSIYPQNSCSDPLCAPPLVFPPDSNGQVQHHPRVYLIFWGPKWTSDPDHVIPALKTLFTSLAHTSYNNILSYYADHTGDYVHNDVSLAGTWIDTSTPGNFLSGGNFVGLSDTAIEVGRSFDTRNNTTPHWTNSPDSQFLVFPQQGTDMPTSNCGEHDKAGGYVYGYVRYTADNSGCTTYANDTPHAMTVVASHEYAEAATDPDGGEWATHRTSLLPTFDQKEIGDLCQYGGFSFYVYTTHQNIAVQPLWDNSMNECAQRDINSNTPYTYMAQGADRTLYAFARGIDNNIWYSHQGPGTLYWSRWVPVAYGHTFVSTPAVGRNADGRLEVFARDSNGAIWHIAQNAENSTAWWSSWSVLSQAYTFAGTPAVASNDDGRLEVFSRGSDGNIWHNYQLPSSGWSGWLPLAYGTTFAGDPAVGFNQFLVDSTGTLEIFARRSDQVVVHNYQDSSGAWSGWTPLAQAYAFVGTPTVGRDEDGHMQIFSRGSDGNIWFSFEIVANSWSLWKPLPTYQNFGSDPAVALDGATNRLFVFAVARDGTMLDTLETGPNTRQWLAWQAESLSGRLVGTPSVQRFSGGSLEKIGYATSNHTLIEDLPFFSPYWSPLYDGYSFQP